MKTILTLVLILCSYGFFAQKIEKIKLKGEKDFGKRELFIYNAHCDGRVFVEVMYGARVYISCYMPVMPAVVSSSLFLPILQLSKEQVDQMQLLAQRAEAHGNAAAMMVCSNLFFWEFEKLLLRKNSGSKTCGY